MQLFRVGCNYLSMIWLNTLRPRQNGRHFADFFLNENVIISVKISLKFVPEGPINNIPALVQIMAWRRPPSDKPLSEPMLDSLLTHICVTRPQWVKRQFHWLLMYELLHPTVLHICNHISISQTPCWLSLSLLIKWATVFINSKQRISYHSTALSCMVITVAS